MFVILPLSTTDIPLQDESNDNDNTQINHLNEQQRLGDNAHLHTSEKATIHKI